MLAAQINFSDFSDITHLSPNGFASNPITSSNRLRMTDNQLAEGRTAWFDTAVPIDTFRTDFIWRPQGNAPIADGFTFCVQNDGLTAEGFGGADLGYKSINNAVAVAFNMYNNNNGGSMMGFASDSDTPITATDMSPIDLHSGDKFKGVITYNGTTLSVTITDLTNKTDVFTTSTTVDIASVLGQHTGFVGFTSSTGTAASFQDFFAWTYEGSLSPPTVATPANATPNPATDDTVALAVLGADTGGEAGLTYTWSIARKPAGAPDPTFSANASNAAKASTATFFKDGGYRLLCTITNANNVTTTSQVTVNVNQTTTAIRVSPHAQHIAQGTTKQYSGTVLDQFGHSMRTQPAITWSLQSGDAGSIDAITGLFTAGTSKTGHVVIEAAVGAITGVSGAAVVV